MAKILATYHVHKHAALLLRQGVLINHTLILREVGIDISRNAHTSLVPSS